MKGLFPLEGGKEVNVFLRKNKLMNISRAVNLSIIRNRASTKPIRSPPFKEERHGDLPLHPTFPSAMEQFH